MIHNFPSFSARALVFSWLALRDKGVTKQTYVIRVDDREFDITIEEKVKVLDIEPEPFEGEGIA